MTYNFDPDRWYDGEYDLLERELKHNRLTQAEFERKSRSCPGNMMI